MDKLKELSDKLNGKIKSQNVFNANLEETSTRKLIVKDYRQYEIKIDEYKDLYSLGVKVDSKLAFSINRPDRIFLYNLPKKFPGLPYQAYVSGGAEDLAQNIPFKRFLDSLAILLKKIDFSSNESVFLYNNYVFFVLAAERELISILDNVIDLLNENDMFLEKAPTKTISPKNIPDSLRPLLPFMKKYGVSDDGDRDQLIEGMSENEKFKLINSIQPYFDEIRIYLDSFQDIPLSEEAMAIGELAELVSELKLKIRK